MSHWPRVIAHVDMDAFYASLEIRDDPTLQGLPVVVGGDSERRGVVAAASYEARKFGVRSALPMKTALKLCPTLVVVTPNFTKYQDASRILRRIFDEFSPKVEPLSLDEAFLDLTGCERIFGSPWEIGEKIGARIRQELRVTASVGISTSKLVAKLASDHQKPNGLTIVGPEHVAAFVQSLPLERLWGVGPATLAALRRAGVPTMAALAAADERTLVAKLGNSAGHLIRLARGEDDRSVEAALRAKSISHEETFATDIRDRALLWSVLLQLAERVARRARRQGLCGRTVRVKLRTADFKTSTRHKTLAKATDAAGAIYETARLLFEAWWTGGPVRLLGVGIENLAETEQRDLFDADAASPVSGLQATLTAVELEALHHAEDEIVHKYGAKAIGRARTLLAAGVEDTGSLPGRGGLVPSGEEEGDAGRLKRKPAS